MVNNTTANNTVGDNIPAPDIDQHEGQRRAHEGHVEHGRAQRHQRGAKDKHPHHVCCPPAEGRLRKGERGEGETACHVSDGSVPIARSCAAYLLEHLAVADEEEHVEEEVESKDAKEHKVGHQAPQLAARPDQVAVEVEGKGGEELQGASDRRGHGERHIRPRDDGKVKEELVGHWEGEGVERRRQQSGMCMC